MPRNHGNSPASCQMVLGFTGEEAQPPVSWRPIHYLGSKYRLLPEICNIMNEVAPSGRVADVFAGSGTVSFALSRYRPVVASDIQEYSRVLCSAVLKPVPFELESLAEFLERCVDRSKKLSAIAGPLLNLEAEAIMSAHDEPTTFCDLVEFGGGNDLTQKPKTLEKSFASFRKNLGLEPRRLMVTRYFGGSYFAYHQAVFMDAILEVIRETSNEGRDIYLAALLSTASDLVNSIGKQFAQPYRLYSKDGHPKLALIRKAINDRRQSPSEVFWGWLERYRQNKSFHDGQAVRGDYREVISQLSDISAIYADPPYTRDHYSRFYHVLETLCLGDFPEISPTAIKSRGLTRGAYREGRHQSPFSIKSQAPEAFKQLFSLAADKDVPMIVSYSPTIKNGHPRLLDVDTIAKIAERYYAVEVREAAAAFAHSKLNRADMHLAANNNAEVFIVCRR